MVFTNSKYCVKVLKFAYYKNVSFLLLNGQNTSNKNTNNKIIGE